MGLSSSQVDSCNKSSAKWLFNSIEAFFNVVFNQILWHLTLDKCSFKFSAFDQQIPQEQKIWKQTLMLSFWLMTCITWVSTEEEDRRKQSVDSSFDVHNQLAEIINIQPKFKCIVPTSWFSHIYRPAANIKYAHSSIYLECVSIGQTQSSLRGNEGCYSIIDNYRTRSSVRGAP